MITLPFVLSFLFEQLPLDEHYPLLWHELEDDEQLLWDELEEHWLLFLDEHEL